MTLLIRTATDADLPLLAHMNKRLIEDEGNRNPMSVVELQDRMNQWLHGDRKFQLFIEDVTIVGYAVYQFQRDEFFPDQTVVYLRQFYIERAKRNRGLGSLAFKMLVRTCFPEKCTIALDVLASNPIGYKFWSRLGFQSYLTTMHLQNQGE